MIKMTNKVSKGSIQILDGFSFYKFIEALSNITDEIPLRFDPVNKVLNIRFMDAQRICLMNINIMMDINTKSKDLKNFLSVKKDVNVEIGGSITGKEVCISLADLKVLLKVKKEVRKAIKLIFGDPHKLEIEKTKDNNYGFIRKSLQYLALEFEPISIDILESIDYLNKISINKRLLVDMFYESNNYSGVCEIETNKKGIYFRETGVKGNSEMFYKCDILEGCDCDSSEKSMYAYSFLNVIKNFLDIMEKDDTINFYQKTDQPLKVVIVLKRINTIISYYVAPRVKEEESID